MTKIDSAYAANRIARLKGDPLLFAAALAILLLIILVGIAMLGGAISIVVVFLTNQHPVGTPPFSPFTLDILIAAGSVVGIALLGLGMRFLEELMMIILSVSDGDPFIADNARRLRMMAWLLLGIQVGGVLLGIYSHWLNNFSHWLKIDPGLSPTGLVGVLALFVLARVFTSGNRMRDDLEGTV